MTRFFISFLLLFLAIHLFSCSLEKKTVQLPPPLQQQHKISSPTPLQALIKQHQKWKNTPYKNGGQSLYGIDCSGLVQQIFAEAFNIYLPRTTKQQKKIGTKVTKKEKRPGDLLFFKTGLFSEHVAIYLENDNFVHASTNRGVIISSLQENYWKNRFFLAKRLSIVD